MNLSQIKVLVDGYNLQLNQGTGIKTYGISSIEALHLLQADLDILFSFHRNLDSNETAVNEALFFDPKSYKLNKRDILSLPLKLLNGKAFYARQLKIANTVVRDRDDIVIGKLLKYAGILTAPYCYDLANLLYNRLSITVNLKLEKSVDIWHATYPLPIQVKGAKKITTIHDLIPLVLPYTTLNNKQKFYQLVKESIETSQIIITVSEHTKKDLIKIFNCPPDKICVTYQPLVLEQFDLNINVAIYLRKYALEPKKYILFVGAIEPKKNLGRLIDAYAMVNPDLPLVVVGKKGWLWEKDLEKINFLAPQTREKIILLNYVSNQDLAYLYKGAYCFVFPSLYEGFGLPPLEAMSAGCPTIASNVSSLPEVCQDGALYIDPYDVGDLVTKLDWLLGDRTLYEKLAIAGQKRARFFSMDNYLPRLLSAYQRVL